MHMYIFHEIKVNFSSHACMCASPEFMHRTGQFSLPFREEEEEGREKV